MAHAVAVAMDLDPTCQAVNQNCSLYRNEVLFSRTLQAASGQLSTLPDDERQGLGTTWQRELRGAHGPPGAC